MVDPQPLPESPSPTPPGPHRHPAGSATLSRDLADFLVEFSIVLHKRSMYPEGHPHLEAGTARFVSRLESLVERREGLSIGIARHQLIIGGVATDPGNALLSDLARRLHRHRVASLRFQRGVTLAEIGGLLGALGSDPGDANGPLGMRLERTAPWNHIQIQPPELGRLLLDGDRDDGAPAEPGGELWVGLANLALSADGAGSSAGEDPLVVARAIDEQVGQIAYDRVVLDYLGNLAEEISGRSGPWDTRTRERVSRLVANLHPETLRSLLAAGADHAERRRFALTASEVLAVDAVVEVVEAAALTTGQTISSHLLRMLHKFAHHAERSSGAMRAEAESVLRSNVARLIADWELTDPNPTEYTAALDGMARHVSPHRGTEDDTEACGSETVLQMALETGCLGPRVYAAVDSLMGDRQVGRVAALLAAAPHQETAEALWGRLATPTRLHELLAAKPVDFTAVQGLALKLGVAAVEPLLDRLESANDQATRARLIRVLLGIGPAAASPAAARLPNAPWYVQRNILVLLRRLGAWPENFSAPACARHPDRRVRSEAYRILLEHPRHRVSAMSHGLTDPDDGVVRLVLHAALESCPPESVSAVERFIGLGRRDAELRAMAVRVLARATGEQAVPRLVQLASERRLLRGWKLAPKSPVVLVALSALARHWRESPEVSRLLEQARAHPDPDFRIAAEGRLA